MNSPVDPVLAELQALRAEMANLTPRQPLDARGLQARGYTEREAYGLLRRHGVKVPGGRRIRISPDILNRIESGEIAP